MADGSASATVVATVADAAGGEFRHIPSTRELQRETDFLKDRVAEINDRLAEIATALNEFGKTEGNGSKDESESK